MGEFAEHDQSLVLDHTGRIATLEEAIKTTKERLEKIDQKLDSNLYLLVIAICTVIVDMIGTHFHILGL